MPDGVVGDGESLRTPMVLMDADSMAGHQPGYALLTDEQVAQRRAARQGMIDRATNAWRGPLDAKRKRPPDDEDDDEDEERGQYNRQAKARGRIGQSALSVKADARDARMAARDGYIKRLTNAWRTPARDAAEPSIHSPPEDLARMRRHVYGAEDPDDPVAKKQAAYEAYRNKLSNAWKSPTGVAHAEASITGAGPKSMAVESSGRTNPGRAGEVQRQLAQWKGGR
jgi:hypothetical protein